MYVYNSEITLDKQEIQVNGSDYPKEYVILDEDAVTGLLVPLTFRKIEFIPVPNKKLNVTTAENGHIVNFESRTKLVIHDNYNADQLLKVINEFLNKEVETERDLTDHELEDSNLAEGIADANEVYMQLKAERVTQE